MQSLCATLTLSPEVVFAMADGFWSELWEEWFRDFFKDAIKTLSILAFLYLVWEGIALLRLGGYPAAYLDVFEKTHFAFMWAAMVVNCGNFVIKQMVGLWPKKRRRNR